MVTRSQGFENGTGVQRSERISEADTVAPAPAAVADTPPKDDRHDTGSTAAVRTASTADSPAGTGTGARAGSPGAGGRKGRDAFFDNAKYLAIVLVAVAHSWEPVMTGSRATKALYLLVYTFHMPAFIVISGYFSRSFTAAPRQLRRLVTGVAVPYLLFESAYSLVRWWGQGFHGLEFSLQDPWFLTWFLISLFAWRLSTPIWKVIKHPLPVALVVAMLASFTPSIGSDLDLQRMLQFLPYFVLGLVLRPEHFRLVQRRAARVLAVPLFAGTLAFTYAIAPKMHNTWLYHTSSAQQMGFRWWTGPVMQLALFGCSLLLTAGFLAWVPTRRTWFTALGAGTLCGYLLHGFFIKAADNLGVFTGHPWFGGPTGEVVLTVAAALLVTGLCTPQVRRAFRWATEPDMAWAFRAGS
jgi:fucose 4-O-acetylase-like acetyltransferase